MARYSLDLEFPIDDFILQRRDKHLPPLMCFLRPSNDFSILLIVREESSRNRSRALLVLVSTDDREIVSVAFFRLDTVLIVEDTVEGPAEDRNSEGGRDDRNRKK